MIHSRPSFPLDGRRHDRQAGCEDAVFDGLCQVQADAGGSVLSHVVLWALSQVAVLTPSGCPSEPLS